LTSTHVCDKSEICVYITMGEVRAHYVVCPGLVCISPDVTIEARMHQNNLSFLRDHALIFVII